MNNDLRRVAPVRPAAAYIGGKKRLAEMLAQHIGGIPHDLYAEPFVGMGGVFFRRTAAPRCEIVNDFSREVTTLFRILQRHYPQFMETLKFQIASRREFERLTAVDPATLTDLERAARFLYLQRLAFGGKVSGQNFGMERWGSSRFDVQRLGPVLEAIHERLSGVVIECLPWRKFIEQYDRAGALFYLDPPYAGSEGDYGAGMFSPSEFGLMAEVLADLKGDFLLSINDTPAIRETFGRFTLTPVTTRYTVANSGWTDANELIITREPLRSTAFDLFSTDAGAQ
jgi:DNA adenine methylase